MKFIKFFFVATITFFISMNLLTHEPSGESFKLSGKITSINLTKEGGVINVSSEAGRYGKVFLTYNVVINQALGNQGHFSGRGIGFNNGERQGGARQGVFRRDGSVLTFWSLDDVSDGNLNYCETTIDLVTEKVEMTFYPL